MLDLFLDLPFAVLSIPFCTVLFVKLIMISSIIFVWMKYFVVCNQLFIELLYVYTLALHSIYSSTRTTQTSAFVIISLKNEEME